MKLEHVALLVADPVAMAAWYETHLGMRVVRKGDAPGHARFLADATGSRGGDDASPGRLLALAARPFADGDDDAKSADRAATRGFGGEVDGGGNFSRRTGQATIGDQRDAAALGLQQSQ